MSVCAILVTALAFITGYAIAGNENETEIKLVSLDYLDAVESDIRAYIDSGDSDAAERIDLLKERIAQCEKQQGGAANAAYTKLSLISGQDLMLGGGCEIIVLSGHLTIKAGGAVDTGAHKIISAGSEIASAHLCITTDECIVGAVSGEVTIMIKGDYSNGQ